MVLMNMDYGDLVRCVKTVIKDDFDAEIIASYLDDCVDYELDFTEYMWNTALFNVVCLEGGKDEAEKYLKEYFDDDVDYTVYEVKELNGVYLETY